MGYIARQASRVHLAGELLGHLQEYPMRSMVLAGLGWLGLVSLSLAEEKFLDPANWEGEKTLWAIQGTTIIGNTGAKGITKNTFLCSKTAYRDFELRFQVRLKGGSGNSGVQIRSRREDLPGFIIKGPQCDIGQQFWGSLYGERFGGMMQAAPPDRVKQALKPKDFNDYAIRCVGKQVKITLNGTVMVEGTFAKMPDSGMIAWQLHAGPPMEVTYRNIQFTAIDE